MLSSSIFEIKLYGPYKTGLDGHLVTQKRDKVSEGACFTGVNGGG